MKTQEEIEQDVKTFTQYLMEMNGELAEQVAEMHINNILIYGKEKADELLAEQIRGIVERP